MRPILLLLLLCAASAGWALDPQRPLSDYVQNQWGLADGLPQVSVHAIAQDRDGYLWIGTQNGVARFDGFRGEGYRRNNNGGHSLTAVFDIHTDREGTVWFATDRGLVRHVDGKFSSVLNRETPANVTAIAEDAAGRIVVATPTGVQRLAGDTLVPHLLQGEPATCLLQAASGPLWVGVPGAVLRFEGERVDRFALAGDGRRVAQALALNGGRLWIGTDADLQSIDATAAAGAVAEVGPLAQPVTSLVADRSGSIWIGTRAALHRLTADGVLSTSDEALLPEMPWIESLFEDADGNLWIGSRIHGLFRVWDGWIRRMQARSTERDGVLWSVATDDKGRLVTGTHNGVFRQEGRSLVPWIDGASLPEPTAYEIAWDRAGNFWIGTRSGLARLAPGSDRPAFVAGTEGRQFSAIIDADDGTLWLGSSRGVMRWQEGRIFPLGPQGDRLDQRIRGILPLGGGAALLATEAGVRRLDGDVVSTPEWASPLAEAFVTGIDAVGDGLVLITTLDHGIGLLRNERLLLLDIQDGLPFQPTWGSRRLGDRVFISGADGVIAVAHADLLTRFDDPTRPTDWRVPVSISGTFRGSLRTRCCNGGARSRAVVDGQRIWYPTLDGALAVESNRLDGEVDTPVVRVETARIAGSPPERARPAVPLVVTGPKRDLSIVYTGFAYRDPAGLRFEYRLDGYDPEWIAAGSRREAFYTNLPVGEYVFRVRAESASRLVTVDDGTLKVIIAPRWHERTIVRLAAAGVFALLLALLFQNRLRSRTENLRARESQLQALVAERTAELAHANEHLRVANRALVHENETDQLTGLANRRWAARHLGSWLARDGVAHDGDTCAVLALIDLDRFKQINDRFGHPGGDELLRHFGELLQRLAGPEASVMRWGGEEFLVVLPAVARDSAATVVDRLWHDLVSHVHPAPDGQPIVLPTSIGYACWPITADGDRSVAWGVALEMADAALFQVKRHARNAWAGLVSTSTASANAFEGGVAGRTQGLIDARIVAWVNIRSRQGLPTTITP